ncbi:hypothetical protein FXO21_25970 [Dyadobacter sp. UC 10]|nr:hypothetical protein FXO21_25970 [Dyadobacter sp. UC 10]
MYLLIKQKTSLDMRSKNFAMALKWIIFLPCILPLCLVYGIIHGTANMVKKMLWSMWNDVSGN